MLSYCDYCDFAFSLDLSVDEYKQYEGYAQLHVSEMLSELLGSWNCVPLTEYQQDKLKAIKKAIGLQVNHLKSQGGVNAKMTTSVSVGTYSEAYASQGFKRFSSEAVFVLKEAFKKGTWL